MNVKIRLDGRHDRGVFTAVSAIDLDFEVIEGEAGKGLAKCY